MDRECHQKTGGGDLRPRCILGLLCSNGVESTRLNGNASVYTIIVMRWLGGLER